MKVVREPADLAEAMATARAESLAAFGRGDLYLEKYLTRPRHIEVQVLGDQHGNVVHLGERDCSMQRRHQKLLEEAPSPALDAATRAAVGAVAAEAVRRLGYRSAGTFEFLYEDGQFYFIEMNTRLQVEHPVTEMICGLDLVREMLRVAAGVPLGFSQSDITFNGHAIECRITAEHPLTFAPSPGVVKEYHAPGGLGIRVDSALYSGYRIPPYYDSMVAKLIAHGPDRQACLMRLRRALAEYVIDGIETTIPLHQRLLEQPEVVSGTYDIHWLEQFVKRGD
jgi:acetyl-CoA carboxylase biotin carboxylase subunit